MAQHHFDVIVVGGGPAGSSAAYCLAKSGFNVAVVDRAVFPRNKLCGGLLSGRSYKVYSAIFEKSWDSTIDIVCHGVDFFNKETKLNSVRDYKPIFFTCRSNFDAHLLELAESAGANVIQGANVTQVDVEATSIVTRNGMRLTSDFLVGADGVSGRVARAISADPCWQSNLALGLEIELPIDRVQWEISEPQIYFGLVEWGYGWIFPKAKTYTIGLGGLLSKNTDIKKAFERFLKIVCDTDPGIPFSGHHIPFGNFLNEPGRGNVLLTGDSAGLVEPITGEGIAFAMQSGRYAAEAIIEAAQTNTPSAAIRFYRPRYRKITDTLSSAKFLRPLIFSGVTESLFIKAVSLSQSIIRKHMDLLADETDYSEYRKFLVGKALTGGINKLLSAKL